MKTETSYCCNYILPISSWLKVLLHIIISSVLAKYKICYCNSLLVIFFLCICVYFISNFFFPWSICFDWISLRKCSCFDLKIAFCNICLTVCPNLSRWFRPWNLTWLIFCCCKVLFSVNVLCKSLMRYHGKIKFFLHKGVLFLDCFWISEGCMLHEGCIYLHVGSHPNIFHLNISVSYISFI